MKAFLILIKKKLKATNCNFFYFSLIYNTAAAAAVCMKLLILEQQF